MARPNAEVAQELSAVGCVPAHQLLETLAAELLPGERVTSAAEVKWKAEGSYIGAGELLTLTTARILKVNYHQRKEKVGWASRNIPERESNHEYIYLKDVVRMEKDLQQADRRSLTVYGIKESGYITFHWERDIIDSNLITRLISDIERKIHEIKTAPSVSRSSSPKSFIDELERLSALKSSGALTEDEFQTAKRKLLG